MSDRPPSIEGRGSWIAASITLAILTISYGSPLLIVVGLKPIQVALKSQPNSSLRIACMRSSLQREVHVSTHAAMPLTISSACRLPVCTYESMRPAMSMLSV